MGNGGYGCNSFDLADLKLQASENNKVVGLESRQTSSVGQRKKLRPKKRKYTKLWEENTHWIV